MTKDQKFLDMALKQAEKSLLQGNYPVGAILVFDNEVIGVSGNSGESSKNYIYHAETALLINNGEKLLQASKEGKTVTLYSTLEPCLMCLGMATMNKVNRIVYIQTDPHAGACSIDRKSLGVRYRESWPELVHLPYTQQARNLIVEFLEKQIQEGKRAEWSKKLLSLLEKTN